MTASTDNNENMVGVLIDLSKAFDTRALCMKCELYIIRVNDLYPIECRIYRGLFSLWFQS